MRLGINDWIEVRLYDEKSAEFKSLSVFRGTEAAQLFSPQERRSLRNGEYSIYVDNTLVYDDFLIEQQCDIRLVKDTCCTSGLKGRPIIICTQHRSSFLILEDRLIGYGADVHWANDQEDVLSLKMVLANAYSLDPLVVHLNEESDVRIKFNEIQRRASADDGLRKHDQGKRLNRSGMLAGRNLAPSQP